RAVVVAHRGVDGEAECGVVGVRALQVGDREADEQLGHDALFSCGALTLAKNKCRVKGECASFDAACIPWRVRQHSILCRSNATPRLPSVEMWPNDATRTTEGTSHGHRAARAARPRTARLRTARPRPRRPSRGRATA